MTSYEIIANPYIFYPMAFLISFSGVLIPGPMTAVSIAKGFKEKTAGLKIAGGHGLIEIPLILLIYYGFASFFQDRESFIITAISISGGVFLGYMGVVMFRLRGQLVEKGMDLPVTSLQAGMITTGGNPSFFVWWATVGALLVLNAASFGITGLILFILVHESADVVWYGLLSYGTHKSRHILSPKFHEALFGVLSVMLIFFGLWFVASVIL